MNYVEIMIDEIERWREREIVGERDREGDDTPMGSQLPSQGPPLRERNGICFDTVTNDHTMLGDDSRW